MASKKIRVFLVHAVQDKPTVRELYARLKSEPWVDPWFDEENLLPGQNWDLEIQKTLRNIDAIIICLSRVSIAKEGYIQKEIKRALDIYDEKPEDAIYIIPLRLDDCEIPFKLKKFHWVDYFNKNYDQKFLGALQARAESLGLLTPKAEPVAPAKPIEPIGYTPGGRPFYTFAEMDFVKVAAGPFLWGLTTEAITRNRSIIFKSATIISSEDFLSPTRIGQSSCLTKMKRRFFRRKN
jgi:hypothetical protein